MTDQIMDVTVEAGLQAEQQLLAAVCKGERDYGLLFWRPTDRALVMPRRMMRRQKIRPARITAPAAAHSRIIGTASRFCG